MFDDGETEDKDKCVLSVALSSLLGPLSLTFGFFLVVCGHSTTGAHYCGCVCVLCFDLLVWGYLFLILTLVCGYPLGM